MLEILHDSCCADKATWRGAVLLSSMRPIRQPYAAKENPCRGVLDVWQGVQQISRRYEEDCGRQTLLFPRLLVFPQPAGQSLPLDGWSERTHVPRSDGMEESGTPAGQEVLPHLPRHNEARGASHSPVRKALYGALGCRERHNALSFMPCQDIRQGRGIRGSVATHCFDRTGGVVC